MEECVMYHWIVCLGNNVVLNTTDQKRWFEFEESAWRDGCDFVNVHNVSDLFVKHDLKYTVIILDENDAKYKEFLSRS